MLRTGVGCARGARSSLRIAPSLLFLVAGCSLPPLSNWHPGPREGHYVEVGTASWYGPGFAGNHTSSGEVYNMGDMTAAHQTLPLFPSMSDDDVTRVAAGVASFKSEV